MLLGAGAVGESYAHLISRKGKQEGWLDVLMIADYSLDRAKGVASRIGGTDLFPAVQVDAGNKDEIVEVLKKNEIDLVMNGCPQQFDKTIFDAAFQAKCHYIDMAASLSEPDPKDPYRKTGILLGDYQFSQHEKWKENGLLALIGMGIDPGVSEVFAKYAEKNLFDEIDEIHVRDGSNMVAEGMPYATGFSVWSVIEECTNPPVLWEKEKGYYTAEPMSFPEIFDFPEGIGPLEVVSIEHEEVINLPRWINKGLKKVSFKISLGKDLMEALKILYAIGLTRTEPVDVKGVKVSPRDVVEACMPNPAEVGPKMVGKICVGTQVIGRKDGKPREVFIYQVSDNLECMRRIGIQAVAAQTAVGPSVATELIAKGIWDAKGVVPPEAMEPEPFLERMEPYGYPYKIRDSWKNSGGINDK